MKTEITIRQVEDKESKMTGLTINTFSIEESAQVPRRYQHQAGVDIYLSNEVTDNVTNKAEYTSGGRGCFSEMKTVMAFKSKQRNEK